MKTLRLALLLLQCLSAAPALAQVYRAGDLVENFTLINRRTGQPINLTDFAGKILFLDFFAHWCPVCNAAAPQLDDGIYRRFREQGNAAGLPVVYVLCNLQADNSPRDVDGTARFISRFGTDAFILEDNNRALQRRFTSEGGQPTFAIINGVANSPNHRQWELVYSLHGYTSPNRVQPIGEFQVAINSVQAPAASAPVSITRPPQSLSVNAGSTAAFSVEAAGTPPLAFQWLKNNQPIAGATQAELILNSVTSTDAGRYSVRVSNATSSVVSAEAGLEVIVLPPPPIPVTITQQPQSQTVNAGTTAMFSVQATGTEPIAYQWLKNDQPIPGATSNTLTLVNPGPGDAGNYSVIVSNPAGSASSVAATLTVLVPPPPPLPASITRHPESQTVNSGANATFTVEAEGTPPLAFQWFKNGEPVPGATSTTLNLPSVARANEGRYFVQVRNATSLASSVMATLTVLIPPPEQMRITLIEPSTGGVRLEWTGGQPPFQVQVRESFDVPWRSIGAPTSARSVVAPIAASQAFIRVVSDFAGD